MKIEKIRWRNFNSYGNSMVEVDLNINNSLILICGQNASGKTTILEVIAFALYGTIPNKKNSSLVNAINKNLECEIEFTSKGHYIKVRRCLQPNSFDVWVDGNSEIIGDVANKKDIQKLLQEYIGVPSKIFHNIIALDINKFISFLKISPRDKRDIIDNIFNLDVINNMFELHKLQFKELKTSIRDLELKIEWNFVEIRNNEKTIQVLLESEKDKTDSINFQNRLDEIYKEVLGFEQKLNDTQHKKTTCNEKIKDFERIKIKNNSELKNINKKLSDLNSDTCPICSNNLGTDFYHDIRTNLEKEIETKTSNSQLCSKQLQILNEKLENINTFISQTKNKISKLNREETNIKFNMKDIDKDTKIKIETLNQKIEEANNSIADFEIELVKLKTKLNFNEIISNVLNETGFKKVMISNLLPTFNLQIENFRHILNIPYNVKFNDDFSVDITIDGYNVDINTLSTGECKKLDLIIVFSLLILIKLQFKNLNLLFLDEIFAGLDISSQNHILEILRKICDKLKLHIFVINHSEMERNNFDKIFFVQKRNNFSEIEQISYEV